MSFINLDPRPFKTALGESSTAFVDYRQSYAILLVDSVGAIFRRHQPPWDYIRAILYAATLLLMPAVVLFFGKELLGNGTALAVGVLTWPVICEIPFASDRRRSGGSSDASAPKRFAVPVLSTALALGIPIMANATNTTIDGVPRGFLWGLAIAGANDVARTIVALGLSASDGAPLYDRPTKSALPEADDAL